ncbi:unnamed protein product, partial [Schistosoma mattheei]
MAKNMQRWIVSSSGIVLFGTRQLDVLASQSLCSLWDSNPVSFATSKTSPSEYKIWFGNLDQLVNSNTDNYSFMYYNSKFILRHIGTFSLYTILSSLLDSNCQLIPPSSSNSDTNTIQLTDPSSSAITITNPTSRIESSPNEQGTDHVDKNRRIGEIVLGLDIAPGEEPLPEGWELARTASGRKFFINHNEHTTTWDDPRVIRPNNQITNGSLLTHEAQRHVMKDLGPLPPGWEERVHSNGRIFYINHMYFSVAVRSVLIYGGETSPLRVEDTRKLLVFDHRCLRNIAG